MCTYNNCVNGVVLPIRLLWSRVSRVRVIYAGIPHVVSVVYKLKRIIMRAFRLAVRKVCNYAEH